MKIGVSLPVRELEDDLAAVKAFARAAERLGFSHLRVPDMVLRPGGGHLHEPLLLLAWIAAVTERIELVPSVIVLPSRQTALFAQAGGGAGQAFRRPGQARRRRWRQRGGIRGDGAGLPQARPTLRRATATAETSVDRRGRCIRGPLGPGARRRAEPVARAAAHPVWIGGRSTPSRSVINRMGAHADGWFGSARRTSFRPSKAPSAAPLKRLAATPTPSAPRRGWRWSAPGRRSGGSGVAGWRELGLTHPMPAPPWAAALNASRASRKAGAGRWGGGRASIH